MPTHHQNSSPWLAIALFAVANLSACGGGGGGGSGASSGTSTEPTGTAPLIPGAVARAALDVPASGKTSWSVSTPTKFSLTRADGTSVLGALSCTSDESLALVVAADCSNIKGMRVGRQIITVSGDGVSAKADVKVIPQPHPVGNNYESEGFSVVVTQNGNVLTWGKNTGGSLGQGNSTLTNVALPVFVRGSSGRDNLSGVVSASGGVYNAFALNEDGEVFSWGVDGYGTLARPVGNGYALPGLVRSSDGTGSLKQIVSVSSGNKSAVALADDGTVFFWGESGLNGPRVQWPTKIVGFAGQVVSVASGSGWSAVLLADGRVMTWGGNDGSSGNLGQGKVVRGDFEPGFVLDKNTGQPITEIVSISTGSYHGLALNRRGQIYAWGGNSRGQLGQGTYSGGGTDLSGVPVGPNSSTAVLVKAPGGSTTWSGIKMVAASFSHCLAVDENGKVYSWGHALDGRLGDGPSGSAAYYVYSSLPIPVLNPAGTGQLGDVASVAVGSSHSMALTTDGRVLIWGRDDGQGTLAQGTTSIIGRGGVPASFLPLPVKNETGSASLAIGAINYWPNLTRRGIL